MHECPYSLIKYLYILIINNNLEGATINSSTSSSLLVEVHTKNYTTLNLLSFMSDYTHLFSPSSAARWLEYIRGSEVKDKYIKLEIKFVTQSIMLRG
jgi:hypothetical protein